MFYYVDRYNKWSEAREHTYPCSTEEQFDTSDFDENAISNYTVDFRNQNKKMAIFKSKPYNYKETKQEESLKSKLNEYIKDSDSELCKSSTAAFDFNEISCARKENTTLSTFLSVSSEMKDDIKVPQLKFTVRQPKINRPFGNVSSLKVPLINAESYVETMTTNSSTRSIVEFDANLFSEINFESIQEDPLYSPQRSSYAQLFYSTGDKSCNFQKKNPEKCNSLAKINKMGKILRDLNINKTTTCNYFYNYSVCCICSTNTINLSNIENNQSLRKIPIFQSKHLNEVNHAKRRNSTEEIKKHILEVKPSKCQQKIELSSSIIDILKHVDKIISTSSVKNQQIQFKGRSFYQRSQTKKELRNKSPKNSGRCNNQQKKLSEAGTAKKKIKSNYSILLS